MKNDNSRRKWSVAIYRPRVFGVAALAAAFEIGMPNISFALSCSGTYYSTSDHTIALSVKTRGAVGDGIHDDGFAIEAALLAAKPGQVVVFPPGTYKYSNNLVLVQPNVTVVGDQAILAPSTPKTAAFEVFGKGDELNGLNFVGPKSPRLSNPESAMILVLQQSGIRIIGNKITGGPSVGIRIDGSSSFLVANNTVIGTNADGIHMTEGSITASTNGVVTGNTVSSNGDDMISVVSYKGIVPVNSNILISNNKVSGNYSGRGITVVGGKDITITGNTIDDVRTGAGIYISQEDSYNTYSDSNILVTGNVLSNIETYPTYPGDPYMPAHHGAIDVHANSGSVTFVAIRGNTITNAKFAGLRFYGSSCNIEASNNVLSSIGGTPLQMIPTSCNALQMSCSGNSVDGQSSGQNQICAGPAISSVTGANLAKLPPATIIQRVSCSP